MKVRWLHVCESKAEGGRRCPGEARKAAERKAATAARKAEKAAAKTETTAKAPAKKSAAKPSAVKNAVSAKATPAPTLAAPRKVRYQAAGPFREVKAPAKRSAAAKKPKPRLVLDVPESEKCPGCAPTPGKMPVFKGNSNDVAKWVKCWDCKGSGRRAA